MIIKPANENILIAYFPEDILILIFIFQQNYFGVSSETDTIGDMDLFYITITNTISQTKLKTVF